MEMASRLFPVESVLQVAGQNSMVVGFLGSSKYQPSIAPHAARSATRGGDVEMPPSPDVVLTTVAAKSSAILELEGGIFWEQEIFVPVVVCVLVRMLFNACKSCDVPALVTM